MAKAPARAEAPPEPVERHELNAGGKLLRIINARIDRLEAGEALSEDPGAELLKLTRAVAALEGERRQQAKLERRAIVALTLATILTWLREQTPEVRAKVRRSIEDIDAPSRRSVLA
jgi:hypothetical protein